MEIITMNDSELQLQVDNEKIENDIKIYASLLPDEIIYNGGASRTQAYYGAVLFADVSGFTDLCEKYNQMVKGGLSRLTVVLNSFIGAMVEEILIREGDVLKFSGDAFLALWKRRKNVPMSEVVHSALDTALSIQESHGTFTTEIGVTLRVKIAISAGHLVFTVLGDSSFMVVGDTIWEIKDVGNACHPGDIIVAPNIMYYVNDTDYMFGEQTAEGYLKVLGTRRSIDQLFTFRDTFNPTLVEAEPEYPTVDSGSEENLQELHVLGEARHDLVPFTLRPSLDYAVQHRMRDYLCNFIIAPVVKVVDQHEPLDCLTEMRLVVIVFINVIVDMDVQLEQLTETIDNTYSVICRVVNTMEGCVNKVSMFDKDLMCLVIFGLRGLNYTLKIQRALQCASHIRSNLRTVRGIHSVSVGVTAGVTYCGVLGHPLRKEYTVIGRTVNKAARLMVAYPDKITCDTYIFLYSRLPGRYFNTQHTVPLKGFQDIGPIYEYNDECQQAITQMQLGKHPVLGRQQQLDVFLRLLDTLTDQCTGTEGGAPQCKMLIVKGDGRQGKSALLSEMAHRAQQNKHLCVYTCSLNHTDTNIPYKAIRCIYYDRLRLSDQHDTASRTDKFAQIFALHQVPEFLCALNAIFHVQFPPSPQYLMLTEDVQSVIRYKLLSYLCTMIFKAPCVLFIDNVHYMDYRSWPLLEVFLNADRVFVCTSDDDYTALPQQALQVLSDARIHTVHLSGIHKKYHGALICHMLEADGLDLDLERHIQVQSEGSPGIIENLVLSLFHSHALGITSTDTHTAYKAGLVSPPASMLYRARIIQLLRHMGYTNTPLEEHCADIETRQHEIWRLYVDCIKNDDDDADSESIPDSGEKLRVCVTVGEQCLTAADTFHTPDVQLMAGYDVLHIQEQQFLKCCAVLGDSFRRSKLLFVWKCTDTRKFNLVIKRLFEARVLACNSGPYRTYGVLQQCYSSNTEPVECVCPDIVVDDNCKDLPRYAMCGFIRFRQDNFRRMVYDMLTESQLKVYHVRAIWYLENETRRCRSCGGGYFTRLLGQIYDDGMLSESTEHLPSATDLNMPFGLSMESIMHGDYMQEDGEELQWLDSEHQIHQHQQQQHQHWHREEMQLHGHAHSCTPDSVMRPRTFADNHLVNCQCTHILDNMYWQMVYHCQETDLYEKLLYASLEYMPLCLRKLNTPLCMELLNTATNILQYKLQDVYPESWQLPLMRARIQTLAGHLHIQCGDLQLAERCLHAALHYYNLTFPRNNVRRAVTLRREQLKQRWLIGHMRNRRYIGIDTRSLAEQTSHTLAGLYTVYRRLGQYKRAYLASVWCLNKALQADSNFCMLCDAYTAVLTMDMYHCRSTAVMGQLERMALSMCYRKLIRLEIHELEAVIQMYVALFTRKCLCENMAKSLHIGYIVLQMNMSRISANYKWLHMALILQAYVCTGELSQALILLQQLSCLQHIHDARLFYLALCLNFRLDTTVLVLPLEQFKLYEVFITRRHQKTIPSADVRYHVALWLWYVRTQNWEREWCLTYHMHDILTWPCVTREPHMVFTYLQLLEGFLLLCRRCIQLCDRATLTQYRTLVHEHLHQLDRVTARLKCARPRFLHLKAYYKMILCKHRRASRLLVRAQALALACSNMYEYKWIGHSRNAWRQSARPVAVHQDPWLRAATGVVQSDWCTTEETVYFTLPLP